MTITVTDHAVLRYLERVMGIDMDQLRDTIQADLGRAAEAAERLGQTKYKVQMNGCVFVIADGACVTVKPKSKRRRIKPVTEQPQ